MRIEAAGVLINGVNHQCTSTNGLGGRKRSQHSITKEHRAEMLAFETLINTKHPHKDNRHLNRRITLEPTTAKRIASN